jgi:hypothetical protein
MNNINSTTKMGVNSDIPLQLFQPMNIIIFLSFFSPIILATSITSLSFIFQNFKGLIYLGFLIGCCVVRNYIYMIKPGETPVLKDKTICTSIQYSKYGNPTFSAFVFAFTITYLCIPMFLNDNANLWIFSVLLCYMFIDIYIKVYKKCVIYTSDVFLNICAGLFCGYLIISLMNWGGSSKFLFFNDIASNKEVCTQPSTQTFKCKVYKDGELVGSI